MTRFAMALALQTISYGVLLDRGVEHPSMNWAAECRDAFGVTLNHIKEAQMEDWILE